MSIRSKDLILIDKKNITEDIYEYTFSGDDFIDVRVGQFINIKIDDFYLRRPISIMESSKKEIKITFKVLGEGTCKLSKILKGTKVNCLYPLGKGFDLSILEDELNINDNQKELNHKPKIKNILIIGGGIGVPPLVGLYKELIKLNKNRVNKYNIETILGFKNQNQVIYENVFEQVKISLDKKDKNIIEYMKKNKLNEKYKDYYIFSCGPSILLNTLADIFENGQVLLEERMGCGFGACMGCSKKVSSTSYKRVCVEGPMFYLEEVRYGIKNNN